MDHFVVLPWRMNYGSLPAVGGLRVGEGLGFVLVLRWRRMVWMVHCSACVPSVVSAALWTVRGRS